MSVRYGIVCERVSERVSGQRNYRAPLYFLRNNSFFGTMPHNFHNNTLSAATDVSLRKVVKHVANTKVKMGPNARQSEIVRAVIRTNFNKVKRSQGAEDTYTYGDNFDEESDCISYDSKEFELPHLRPEDIADVASIEENAAAQAAKHEKKLKAQRVLKVKELEETGLYCHDNRHHINSNKSFKEVLGAASTTNDNGKASLYSIDKYKTAVANTSNSYRTLNSTLPTILKDTFPSKVNDIKVKNNVSKTQSKLLRAKTEAKLELNVLKAAVKADISNNRVTAATQEAELLKEKALDLYEEANEKWCSSHGKRVTGEYNNKEKRQLRCWFKELDYDNSGEVNVNELQDALISSGILKTREQVKRVLTNADKNRSAGIDFDEFISAINSNTLADKKKMKVLQSMNNNDYGFDTSTLISALRRKKIWNSVVKQNKKRAKEFDSCFAKFLNPKQVRRDKEKAARELETLEEKHSKSVRLHGEYMDNISGVMSYMQSRYDDERKKEMEVIMKESESSNSYRIRLIPNIQSTSDEGDLIDDFDLDMLLLCN